MSSSHLTVRPEDVLLACVAYTRTELLTLDKIISLHSREALVLDPSVDNKTSLLALPAELLLRIRAQLQSTLIASLASETAVALEEYQAMLVEGICPDCYWWNTDIYGPDIWAWVENGYRGACSCCVVGDIDPRSPSESKLRLTKKFEGIDIGTRGQWLRAHIARTYLGKNATAWSFARGVLAEFGCAHRFERVHAAAIQSTTMIPESMTYSEPKKALRRTTTCDFGALVRISQSPQRSSCTAEEPVITLGRLLRELDLQAPADDEPSIALQSSATRFVDKIHRRPACTMHFLAQRGPICNCMDCLAHFAAPASLTSYAFARPRSFTSAQRSCMMPLLSLSLPPFYSTLTSLALGAASVAYLVARVVL